ncbi:MAG: ferritin-like domain-containing protein [Minwuiales bacterium]|nr:ferritin-like domain-containing protein [Minwuiales bacterium]
MTATGGRFGDLASSAVTVLRTSDPTAKADLSRRIAAGWRDRSIADIGHAEPPDRPARPDRPPLLAPREMPKRRAGGSLAGRIALLHALAHIELNAIDLAWDLIARFADAGLPRQFFDDWVCVADEEGKHFLLLRERLADLNAAYGDLPAHDGLWEAATETAGDLLARLAVVPLVLEARGLDVTPAMIDRLESQGDEASAAVLKVIYQDEIGHVSTGRRWFEYLCADRGLPPEPTYHQLVRQYFRGQLKRPFNRSARDLAGFSAGFYEPLASGGS